MIAGYGCKPVFQYKFRPLAETRRRKPNGGFSVILYENSILSFSTYAVDGSFCQELCFSLPSWVLVRFRDCLNASAYWLASCPCDIQYGTDSRSASSFAFDGYNPIRVWGMDKLLQAPVGDEFGFYARHIHVLFEDVSWLLSELGIHLVLDGFVWDSQVTPFQKNQLYGSTRLGAV